jgi:hypothetical protein
LNRQADILAAKEEKQQKNKVYRDNQKGAPTVHKLVIFVQLLLPEFWEFEKLLSGVTKEGLREGYILFAPIKVFCNHQNKSNFIGLP